MNPTIAIDLFCGLGGWAEGLLAEGWKVFGFDIECHAYGEHRYPAQLVLQDVLTLHGSQFKDAALIVASPPCQEFSYMAMPWTKAKEKQRRIEACPNERKRLTTLFDACFRIQREACEAAGHHIPMVVENVRGAQKWVGRSRWNYGSFHLWGDVPALMPIVKNNRMKFPAHCGPRMWSEREYHRLNDGNASAFHREGLTNRAYKSSGMNWSDREKRGQDFTRIASRQAMGGTKVGKDWFGGYGGDFGWDCSPMRRNSSKSNARKAASALIAKIPFELARHIARCWKPRSAPLSA